MRGFVPMLVLKARVELADGDYAAAAHWLETGFAFSRHVGDGPFLINRLVGVACANQFADGLLDFVDRPDAPNLYWSLANLPRPLIDMRDSLDLEYLFLGMQFPDLADLDRPRSPEQWDAVLKKVRTEYRLIVGLGNESGGDNRLKPHRRHGAGRPGREVARLAGGPQVPDRTEEAGGGQGRGHAARPGAAALPGGLRTTNSATTPTRRPTCRTRKPGRRFAEADARLKAAPDTEGQRFAYALLPAIAKVKGAETRLDRKIAALRVIEALRLHAAAHDGALPDKLSDVTVVPIPDDPGTASAGPRFAASAPDRVIQPRTRSRAVASTRAASGTGQAARPAARSGARPLATGR